MFTSALTSRSPPNVVIPEMSTFELISRASPKVEIPDTLSVPSTSSFAVGSVVPTPIFPLVVIATTVSP